MKIKTLLLFLVVLVMTARINGQLPKVLIMDANHLAEVKKKAQQKDRQVLQLIDELKKQADDLLEMEPLSVMDKQFTPVSGNKHDYMSQAPYFWYDSTKPNGLPYKRRDGVRNPEIEQITDRTYIGKLETALRTLSLAFYFADDNKYAAKASTLLHTWFINEATKMNPHLEYGQAIPGVNTGRGIGIIETRTLMGIADAVGLLEGSASWTKADTKSMKDWYAKYLDWLLTSKNGKDEHAAKNNHGTWFYAQSIDFALFIENRELAKKLAEESKRRLDSQLTSEGRQPLELDRTNGFGYCTFNLLAWFDVAKLAEKVGVDLWSYQTPAGASIRLAVTWLIPYAVGDKKWPYQQIGEYDKKELYTLLLKAANKFKENSYKVYAEQNLGKKINDPLIGLLYSI